jgi:hypothetical protein
MLSMLGLQLLFLLRLGVNTGYGDGTHTDSANGTTSAVVSTATLGFKTIDGPFELNEFDLANGAGISQAIAEVSSNVLVGVGSGGLACSGKLGQVGSQAVRYWDAAGNVVTTSRGVAGAYTNGLNLENGVQIVGGGLGLVGNLGQACFTEGTQIVVGAEYDANGVFVQYVTVTALAVKMSS